LGFHNGRAVFFRLKSSKKIILPQVIILMTFFR